LEPSVENMQGTLFLGEHSQQHTTLHRGTCNNAPIIVEPAVPWRLLVPALIDGPHGFHAIHADRVRRHTDDLTMAEVGIVQSPVLGTFLPRAENPKVGDGARPVRGGEACERREEGGIQDVRVQEIYQSCGAEADHDVGHHVDGFIFYDVRCAHWSRSGDFKCCHRLDECRRES